ncbi:MAG: aminotransferase class I/II-fold pyridoxal phosphate-dependent enzyme [Paracoccaceae bacterium]
MVIPERFSNLPVYAFPRLRDLLDGVAPGGEALRMTIGEPRHAFPAFVSEIIARHAHEFGQYPVNDGAPELLESIAAWVQSRFSAAINDDQIMVLNGTREGLFAAAMALCPETKNGAQPLVLMPNPFYQVYSVAALAVGARPVYLPATKESGYLPDFDAVAPEDLDQTAIVYLCTPSNPQGAVASKEYLSNLMALAEKHDFRIFCDECYSEVWRDVPPPGALQVANEIGADPERVFIFHSLSKRSNLPGLRVGFVAGGPKGIAEIRQLRAYAGAPISMPLQRAATAVWQDEEHVEASRQRYVGKYDIANQVFDGVEGYTAPSAGFFLWLPVEDGEEAAKKIWRESGVQVLPGAYLSRDVDGKNPGKGYIRVAMVVEEQEMQRGLKTIRDCLY